MFNKGNSINNNLHYRTLSIAGERYYWLVRFSEFHSYYIFTSIWIPQTRTNQIIQKRLNLFIARLLNSFLTTHLLKLKIVSLRHQVAFFLHLPSLCLVVLVPACLATTAFSRNPLKFFYVIKIPRLPLILLSFLILMVSPNCYWPKGWLHLV